MDLCKQFKYERSIQPGKALFFYKTAGSDFIPLQVDKKTIRGQKCSYSEGYSRLSNTNATPQDLAYSNPVKMESVSVPPMVDGIYCRFNLRIFANSLEPTICDNLTTYQICKKLAEEYKRLGGYKILAERYSKNILLGEWLFRNRDSYPITIDVKTTSGNHYVLANANHFDWHSNENVFLDLVTQLANEVSVALSEPRTYWSAEITGKIDACMGEEIYPSQQFLESTDRETRLSKGFCNITYPDGRSGVVLNMEKVGAGIQKIDDWYSNDADRRIRVHEYGADIKHVIALRRPEGNNDFYHLIRNAESFLKTLKKLPDNKPDKIQPEIHYVMAVLIKGGMFQKGGDNA